MSMNDANFSPPDPRGLPSSLPTSESNETSSMAAHHAHMRGLSAFGVQGLALFRPEDTQQVC